VVITFKESDGDGVRRVRLLTVTLRYDDLLADCAAAFAYELASLPLRIGRSPDEGPARVDGPARLVVPDPWASTAHCYIDRVGTSDVLYDEGSRNGTHVNGERVTRYHVLADGDVIEVGRTLVTYRVVDAAEAEALTAPGAVSAGPTRTCNPELAGIARDLRVLATSREPVLVEGEAGVGKETLARALHAWSGRGALRVVACDGVADGAFADSLDGGTVILDEVGRLGPSAQTTLLRALDDGRDVRWIATTSEALFATGAPLRADLVRSLAGYVARVPPLRRRREDLGTLGAWLLRAAGVARASITPAAGRALYLSSLGGNLRQLRTVLRAAATLAGDGPIDARHLPPLDVTAVPAAPASHDAPRAAPRKTAPTRDEVVGALEATGGNIVRTAECLGSHPRQVYRWIERHEIPLDRYRR
jgi:DNA-binding NtrC family response regulator